MKSIKTAIVVGGLSLSGKGTLAKLLKERLNGDGHVFEMGEEFRQLKEGKTDREYPQIVHDFVRLRMPKGEIATLEEFVPVFEAAWERHLPKLRAARVAVFDGAVRTPEQWPVFRRKAAELFGGEPHRICVVWLERPDEVCLANWRKRQGEGSTRCDDNGGEPVQRYRLARAREEWAPLHSYFASGKSTSHFRYLDMGDGKVEHRIDELCGWVRGVPAVWNPPRPAHDFLRGTATHEPAEHLTLAVA